MKYVVTFILTLAIPILSNAQDGVGAFDLGGILESTVRSVNVNSKDIEGKPDWCTYSVKNKMDEFMDDDKRTEFQSHTFLNIGDRFESCLWINACNTGWDHANYYLEGMLRASKEIQMKWFEDKKKEIEEYNRQTKLEGKPLKQMPTGLPQLRGVTDEFADYLYVSLETFTDLMTYNCNNYFALHKLDKTIDPKLDQKNDKQDASYVASHQYADGMFRNLHYHFVLLMQNHVQFVPNDEIYDNYYRYSFVKKIGWKKQ